MKKNIIANFIGRFWSTFSNFLFIPLYIRYLGFESFSIISFTLVIAGLMTILDSGLTATLSREFARSDNSQNEKIRVFQTLESTYFIIFGIVICAIFFSSGYIAHSWLNLKEYNSDRVALFLKIISFDIGFQMILGFYLGGLIGLEKQVKANFIQIGWGLCRNGIVVLVILFYPKLETFFIWQAISTIAFAIIMRIYLIKAFGSNSFSLQKLKIEKTVFNNIWRFAGGMVLISLVAAINTQIDKLMISKLLSIESLGYYTLAVSLSMGLIAVARPFSTALLPRFTALYSTGKKVEASQLFITSNSFVSILIFSLMVSLILFPKQIIWAWTGNMELAINASAFLPIISISYTTISLSIIPYNIAIANGYTRLNNLLGISSLIVTVPGYWFATHFYGAIGTAWVFCIVQLLITSIYIFFINKKFLTRIPMYLLYIKGIIIPVFIALLVTYFFSLFISAVENSRILSICYIAISSICTLAVLILFTFPNEIKQFHLSKYLNLKSSRNNE